MFNSPCRKRFSALRYLAYLPERLEERRLLASQPVLVADLNTDGLGSSPGGFTVFNNALYFSAFDDLHGQELWKYDGVAATRVTDIDPGPGSNPFIGPEELTVFKGALYFRAFHPATGMELWKYDGNNATLAADIFPGVSGYAPYHNSRPQGLKVIGDWLYFSASDGVSGREIWRFDGISASRVVDLNPGPGDSEPYASTYDFTEFAGAVYFIANPGDNNNRLFRYDGQNIVRVDSVAGGPQIQPFYGAENLVAFDGALYFSGAAVGDNLDRELWKFDGTGYSRVADIRPGPDGSWPKGLFTFKDALYFSASESASVGGLYRFDGVSVTRVEGMAPGPVDAPSGEFAPVIFDGDAYFAAGGQLHRFDGASTTPVSDVPVWRQGGAVFGHALYVAGEFQPSGSELARYDGDSVSLVADIRAGTQPAGPGNFSSFGGELYFTADSDQSSHGEIWKYDGTATQIADPSRDYFLPTAMVIVNGQQYFAAANDGDDGYELWRYDGDHSTKLLGDVNGFNVYPPQLGVLGNDLLFWGYGTQGGGDGPTVLGLWAFDGTTARPVAPGLVGNGDFPDSSSFTNFNGALYFRASEVYGGTMELWKFDGNSVVRAPGIPAGTLAISRGMNVYDGELYFGASDQASGGNYELWKYDGTQATLAAEIRPGPDGSDPAGFEIHEGSLYFGASGDQFGYQLWRFNSGTGAATRVTSNLALGPANLRTLAGVLYFWASTDSSTPVSLWSYDGVEAEQVAELRSGSSFFRFNGALYFGADDGLHGYELWKLEPDVLTGDLNRDGTVSIADFVTLASNFEKTNAGWADGDLNYDGRVSISDFIDLSANFGKSTIQPAEAEAEEREEPVHAAQSSVSNQPVKKPAAELNRKRSSLRVRSLARARHSHHARRHI
jgi:trimeric autotransporter adhesin